MKNKNKAYYQLIKLVENCKNLDELDIKKVKEILNKDFLLEDWNIKKKNNNKEEI